MIKKVIIFAAKKKVRKGRFSSKNVSLQIDVFVLSLQKHTDTAMTFFFNFREVYKYFVTNKIRTLLLQGIFTSIHLDCVLKHSIARFKLAVHLTRVPVHLKKTIGLV